MKPLTNRSAVLAFLVVAVLSILPFAFVMIPPLVDYPNHLARCSVLASLSQNLALQSMYEQREVILPNLAMDAVVVPLTHLMPVVDAGKLFCVSILLLTLSGSIALSYSLMRKITAWSFAPSLLLYNHIFTFGFLNYLFGVAVLMWALAAWVAMRERRRSARIAVGVFFAVILFLSHIVAMGLFACALAGLELSRCVEPRGIRAKALATSVAEVAALFVVPAIMLLGSPTHTEAAEYHASSLWAKLGAIGEVLRVAPGRVDVLYSLLVLIGVLVLVGSRSIRIERRVIYMAAAAFGAFLLLPESFTTSGYVDSRVPITIALMLASGSEFRRTDAGTCRLAAAALACLFGFRVGQITTDWSSWDQRSRQIISDLSILPEKAVVFTASEKGAHIYDELGWNPPLVHLPVAELIFKPLFFPQLFALPAQQPLAIRPELLNLEEFQDTDPFEFDGAAELGGVITMCREEADDQDDVPPALGRYPQFYLFVIGKTVNSGYSHAELVLQRPGYALFKILNSEPANERRWRNRRKFIGDRSR